MSAIAHELLPRDTGLPAPVRVALNDAAAACNHAAIAVNHAFAFVVQYTNERETLATEGDDEQTSGSERTSERARVADDLENIADSFHDQALVALTRAAARYAVYASHVATELIAGRPATLPDATAVKPSDLIAVLDTHLPEIEFPPSADPSIIEKVADVQAARYELWQITSRQLHGQNALAYDDPAAVRADADKPYGISATFPEALHHYAAALTSALDTLTELR